MCSRADKLQLLSLCTATTWSLRGYNLCSVTREATAMRNLSTAMKSIPHIDTRESLLTATRIQHRKKLKKIKSKPIKGCRPCAHADPSQQLHSWATAKNSSPNLPGLRHTFLRHEPIVSLPLPSKAVKLLLFKNFYFLIFTLFYFTQNCFQDSTWQWYTEAKLLSSGSDVMIK